MRRLAVLLLAIAPIVAITAPSPAEACSFVEGVRKVAALPADGATDVPTNAQIQVTYHIVGSWPFTDEVSVRAVGSTTVVPATITRDDYHWNEVVTVQPSAPLAPATAYEIVDTVPDCDDFIDMCAATEPDVIATFTTGAGPDETPPTTGTVSVNLRFIDLEPRSSCGEGSQLVVTPLVGGLADAGTAPDQLRIRVYGQDGQPLTGAFSPGYSQDGRPDSAVLPFELGAFCTGSGAPGFDASVGSLGRALNPFTIRAVDLAGNEDANAGTVIIPGCPNFDANNDGFSDREPEGPGDPSGPGVPDGVGSDEGCSAAPGAGPLVGLGLSLVALLRRRRRATPTT